MTFAGGSLLMKIIQTVNMIKNASGKDKYE